MHLMKNQNVETPQVPDITSVEQRNPYAWRVATGILVASAALTFSGLYTGYQMGHEDGRQAGIEEVEDSQPGLHSEISFDGSKFDAMFPETSNSDSN